MPGGIRVGGSYIRLARNERIGDETGFMVFELMVPTIFAWLGMKE